VLQEAGKPALLHCQQRLQTTYTGSARLLKQTLNQVLCKPVNFSEVTPKVQVKHTFIQCQSWQQTMMPRVTAKYTVKRCCLTENRSHKVFTLIILAQIIRLTRGLNPGLTDRSFAVASPRVLKCLPASLRAQKTASSSKSY